MEQRFRVAQMLEEGKTYLEIQNAGGGIAYGYQWLLGRRWSIEASLGVGYVRAGYDRYECPHCGEWQGDGKENYFGVTKAAVSLIYVIK